MNKKLSNTPDHKIALYLRTATKPSKADCKIQERKLRRHLRLRNKQVNLGKIVGTFSDIGKSGVDFQRPKLQALLRAIRHKKVTLVLTADISRLSRSITDLSLVLDTLRKEGCQLETLSGPVRLETITLLGVRS